MTSEEQRAALAAHEALNRVADDVIAGRIGGSAQHAHPADEPVSSEQVPHEPAPETQAHVPAESNVPEHYVEPQSYPHYEPASEAAARQEYAAHEYAPQYDAHEHDAPPQYTQDSYAQLQPQPQSTDPYAATYTPEQQAAEQQAAEAYAAQFAASIAETAVASATQHAHQAPEEAPPMNTAPSAMYAPEPPPIAAAPPPAAVRDKRDRMSLLTWFFGLVAVLAIGISFYQGYLFHRSTEAMEKNVARGEFARTCRDIVGAYFDVKQKVSMLMPAADRGNIAGASRVTEANRLEAQAAITKFSGLSTYLANFQDVSARVRYTELTRTLNGVMDVARTTPLTDLDRVFAPADKIFSDLNDDCVKTSSALRN